MNYTEAILRDVLCRGLEDLEIQLDLLGDNNQDMTLEQILRFIEAKEAGKRSAMQLLLPHATDAVTGSTYKRQKRDAAEESSQDPCSYCGRRGHGRSAPTRLRSKECPAYGTVCGNCKKDHHFESVCRGRAKTKSSRISEQESAVFDTLCELTIQCNMASVSLDHHVYDQASDKWLRHPSKSQPFVRLSMAVQKEDYKHFGFHLSVQPNTVSVDAMADTGCQSCLLKSWDYPAKTSFQSTCGCTLLTIVTFQSWELLSSDCPGGINWVMRGQPDRLPISPTALTSCSSAGRHVWI